MTRNAHQNSGGRHGDDQRRSTKRYEGKGNSRDREEADNGTDIDDSLHRDPHNDGHGEQLPVVIRRFRGNAEPLQGERGDQGENNQGTDDSKLLADDRKDEVSMRIWQEAPLLMASAEAEAEEVSGTKTNERLIDLVARSGGI